MKREVEREVRLPAFSLERGELELLWNRITQLFTGEGSVRKSIALSLPGERLEFESMEELRQYAELRGRATNFSIFASRGGFSVSLRTGGLFTNVPVLKVQGDSDIWCASAIEAVMTVILRNRVWYWWLLRLPITLMLFLVALAPSTAEWLLSKKVELSPSATLAWFSVIATLGFISFTHERLLPTASLVFTNDLGFVRRYGAELGLVLGVVSFIASIFMWLYPRAA
jgi:hypothetical protein